MWDSVLTGLGVKLWSQPPLDRSETTVCQALSSYEAKAKAELEERQAKPFHFGRY